jgi:hypothetical protein
MRRILGPITVGTMLSAAAIFAAGADDQKVKIAGGIEGHVMKVDVEGKKLTVTTAQGQERIFTITDETTMLGPNGGKVRKHLKDPRFREGFPVTIVAEGNTAEEVHFGFAKDAIGNKSGETTSLKPRTPIDSPKGTADRSQEPKSQSAPPATTAKSVTGQTQVTKSEEVDDEDEIPGHVKSFDPPRRLLVLTLLNGKTRSFMLAHDVPVYIKGEVKASSQGLKDPQLKDGAFVTVITDDGGRKVKELKITPASEVKRRKAG